jgi:putative CocE/NonD family hydrolase
MTLTRPAAPTKATLSQYVTMKDGTKIAVDVWLPPGMEQGSKIPTVVCFTRYWRGIDFVTYSDAFDAMGKDARQFLARGYANVIVDARGTGASFGSNAIPFGRDEMADDGVMLDWITAQPWSNGRVAAEGVSYIGTTAAIAAGLGRPAVRAVIPRHYNWDAAQTPGAPGGIRSEWFGKAYAELTHTMDANDVCGLVSLQASFAGAAGSLPCSAVHNVAKGVAPVGGEAGRALLDQALAEHAKNIDLIQAGRGLEFRDDPFSADGQSLASVSPYTYRDAMQKGGAAWFTWASWYDGMSAESGLSQFRSLTTPQHVIIGAWTHGAEGDADPFHAPGTPVEPPIDEQFKRTMDFLDPILKTDGPPPTRQIEYYTVGEGVWRTTAEWPPAGVTNQDWYFGDQESLEPKAPSSETATDRYDVDFTATTGPRSRWRSTLVTVGGPVVYPDRASEDAKLLSYTAAPLAHDMRVTGHPIVTLHVSSTESDGAFIAYLEDVGPDGRVTYVGEGELRALHRRVSSATPPFPPVGPYHSMLRADAEPLTPGEPAELTFAMNPISALFRAGHRVRIAIAGADHETFARIPETGNPTVTVFRTAARPSHVTLPVAQ